MLEQSRQKEHSDCFLFLFFFIFFYNNVFNSDLDLLSIIFENYDTKDLENINKLEHIWIQLIYNKHYELYIHLFKKLLLSDDNGTCKPTKKQTLSVYEFFEKYRRARTQVARSGQTRHACPYISDKDSFNHKNNNRNNNNNNNNNMAVDVSPLTDTTSPIKLGHKHHTNRLNLDRLKLNTPTQKELESIYLSNYHNQTQIEFTFHSVLIGLSIGLLLCWYNIFFRLKNGNIVLGLVQSSLLGFGILKLCEKFGSYSSSRLGLNIIQTIAVASSHMPVAAGFVGLIPTLSKLDDKNDIDADPFTLLMEELFIWTLSLSLFGLFIVVPLRNEFIVNQNLTFPSGTATAKMIELFYSKHLVSQIATEMQMEKAKLSLFIFILLFPFFIVCLALL